ncbi:MAG: 2-hydroxyacid dehydrogenase [Bacillota bacterium]|jgi:lactate dehydrogenase-like 2-hydroxyacid dehydrogenase
MKIAILTSKKRVEKYSDFNQIPKDWNLVYIDKQYTDQEVLQTAGDADGLFVDAINPVSAYLIENMPNLKIIQSEGVAYDRYDMQAATKAGVYICNNSSANSASVAEHTIMLMLALLRRLLEGHDMVINGQQIQAKESFILDGIKELSSCHIGLIGFGAIGKETAKRLRAFDCQVSYYTPKQKNREIEEQYQACYLPLDQLVKQSDIISLHLPVLPSTTGMVNDTFLHMMKKTALLINTARGEIIDQKALAEALNQGQIAGAAIDTLFPEPATLNNPLLNLTEAAKAKIIFTPHIAGTTNNVFYKMYQNSWNNMNLVSEGKRPQNIVNGL